MKVTYYVASSLDGYIAKEDGDVSWLEELDISLEEAGYDEFYSTVDAIVMGRKTYEMIITFGQWPYGDKPIWVCTSSEVKAMEGCNLQVGNTPETAYQSASEMNINHLWLVGGGSLSSSFLQNNLLTNVSLSLMPIILGNGIKLFGALPKPAQLIKNNSEQHGSGMMQLDYTIKNA
jgi:dihydrofolate reductase